MKSSCYTAALTAMAVSLASGFSVPRAGSYLDNKDFSKTLTEPIHKRASKDLGLPNDLLKTNCISVGFLPSEGDSASPPYTMKQINGKLGAKSSTYGWYAQIRSSNFDGQQLLAIKQDVIDSGAVFVASVMPSINFNQITPAVAKQVAAVMKEFTDAGVTVWLRYAHEMNWYVVDKTYHGTPADFITSWKNIYEANCAENDKVSCFWSPNQAGRVSDLEPWWPGEEFVDLVGIDCYPRNKDDVGDAEFDRLYGDFYNTYSKPYNLPFAIGETGAGDGMKSEWLKTLVSPDKKTKYPNYVSMSWFEFDKEADFRIVMTDDTTLQQTKQSLLSGSGDSCGAGNGSGNGTTVPIATPKPTFTGSPVTTGVPAATGTSKAVPGPANSGASCNWGCWGWDCSANVPCQGPWTCKGGYCK